MWRLISEFRVIDMQSRSGCGGSLDWCLFEKTKRLTAATHQLVVHTTFFLKLAFACTETKDRRHQDARNDCYSHPKAWRTNWWCRCSRPEGAKFFWAKKCVSQGTMGTYGNHCHGHSVGLAIRIKGLHFHVPYVLVLLSYCWSCCSLESVP